ncbi:uncharacterized protein LOC135124909 [Zophobas morio]|uniref:uncharacterized protein LOC135124909 n=1 Tax=Zophobas morio TaxID=2755281 RepID=UPI0030837280
MIILYVASNICVPAYRAHPRRTSSAFKRLFVLAPIMRSDSDSDSQEEDEKLKEEIRQIEERKIRRKLLKKQSLATSNTLSPETSCSSSKKLNNIDVDEDRNKGNPGSSVQVTSNNNLCLEDDNKGQQDRFRTYKKLPGAVDHGKEYEQMMCAFYALKLIARDDVEDFEMTTNNKEYGVFDDIGLTVTFKNTKRQIYLIQLKHKEGGKFITSNNLRNQKNDFGLQKYFNSVSSLNITEDVVYIVSTNSSTYIKQNTEISPDIVLEVRDCIEYEDLLLNVQERKSSTIFQIVQKLEDKNQMFYFFTEQNNIHNTKVSVQKMLYELMQCNIYDSFMHFMSEWWSKSFVLAKDDVIAKLAELVVSPYLKTLTDDKKNAKTENLRKAITNFSLTIVEKTDENIIENIWPTESITDDEFNKTKEKFELKITEQMKILWFLNKVPLVIKVDDLNIAAIKCAVKLIDKSADKKKIILEGNVTKCEFDGMQVFQDLSDLIQKCEREECCRSVLESFEVSLQGREPICLEEL